MGFEKFLVDLAPRIRQLLARRDALQAQIDNWHRQRRGKNFDAAAYRAFLSEIGYLAPEARGFAVGTARVDVEIAQIAGPQLGGADHQCALCAERRQCPVGQPL